MRVVVDMQHWISGNPCLVILSWDLEKPVSELRRPQGALVLRVSIYRPWWSLAITTSLLCSFLSSDLCLFASNAALSLGPLRLCQTLHTLNCYSSVSTLSSAQGIDWH